jgi:hypothetical protein
MLLSSPHWEPSTRLASLSSKKHLSGAKGRKINSVVLFRTTQQVTGYRTTTKKDNSMRLVGTILDNPSLISVPQKDSTPFPRWPGSERYCLSSKFMHYFFLQPGGGSCAKYRSTISESSF